MERAKPSAPWPASLAALRPFEYLVLVGQHGSIREAAEKYGYSQPTVSAAITKLENMLDYHVLERRGRLGSQLTEQGGAVVDAFAVLVEHAQEFDTLLKVLGNGVSDLKAPENKDPHSFVVAASTTTCDMLAPRWINLLALGVDAPRLSLLSARSSHVIDSVKNVEDGGRAESDVGFIANDASDTELKDEHGLLSDEVGGDEIVIVVSPKHRWANRSSITVEELVEEPQVAREEGSGALDVFRRALEEVTDTKIEVSFRTNSSVALRQAVVDHWHPAALSSMAVTDQLASGALREVKVENLPKGKPASARIQRTRRAVWPQSGENHPELREALVGIARQNSIYRRTPEGRP